MKIIVLNGTSQKGITYHMKEMFLSHFPRDTKIAEYYPKDMPPFCVGCKNCILRGEEKCPHAEKVLPIWNDLLDADLLVFAYPIYALRVPASIKSLLDHLCVHWMGVSKINTMSALMMGDVLWNKISKKHVTMLEDKMEKLYQRVKNEKPVVHKNLTVGLKFNVCKKLHKGILKTEETPSLDNQHFLDRGWIMR